MIRLGGHGVPASSDDPYEFARAHADFGYGAAYCPPAEIGDGPRLADIEKAFAAVDVTIAEVGIWKNLITPDETVRKANLAIAAEKLAIADAVGARCAISYIGSYRAGTDYAPARENFSEDAFDACVEVSRLLLDTVKPKRAKFTLEMMQYSVPDSPDGYRDLILAIDRPNFGAHFDPVNFVMTPRQYWDTGALIRECFDKLGQWVVSCHAKDVVLRQEPTSMHLDEIIPGKGELDYGAFLAELARLPREVPLMMEHLTDAEYAAGRDAIYAAGDATGVSFANRVQRA